MIDNQYKFSDITERIIGCAIEVHKHLGPGLLESAYEECLAYELVCNGLKVERQKPLPITYKDIHLDYGYRDWETDRKSTRLNSSHSGESRMPSSS